MRWFKHDSDASSDAKLRKLRIRYGMQGYGLYWYCLELIVSDVELHNLTFELEHDAEILAADTGIHQEEIQKMMKFMVDIGLFENREGIISCLKVAKRLDQSMTSNPKMRERIKQIHHLMPDRTMIGTPQNHDGVMTPSDDSHDGIMQEKKRREEKRRDTPKRFTPPTFKDVSTYCKDRNNDIDPQTFLDHYAAAGWMRGKTKIKDWKACVRTWERSDSRQQKPALGATGI